MQIKDFRKLKVIFLKDNGEILTIEDVEKFLEDGNTKDRWFLRGVKHIIENHYTEAIKRFQLVDDPDANLLVLACAYKLQDMYIYNEYKGKQITDGKFFNKYGIRPAFYYENKIYNLSHLFQIL